MVEMRGITMDKDQYFEEIYENYRDKIFKFIYYKVCNAELAEDLTNDVFVAVYKNLHTYDANKSFISTWLYAISYNRLKNYYKSRKITEYSIEYMLEMNIIPRSELHDLLEQEELRLMLKNAMQELPERNRKIILMKYYLDMTSGEIGRDLNITPGNVRIILKRSLNTLKKMLNHKLSR